MDQIFPAHWTHLPHEVRELLAKQFKIGRSSFTEIVDNKLVSDGRTVNDLKVVTREAMQEYLNDKKEENFARLWELTQSKARYELNPPVELQKSVETVDKPVESVDKVKEVNPFRELKKEEKQVLEILEKTHVKPKRASKK